MKQVLIVSVIVFLIWFSVCLMVKWMRNVTLSTKMVIVNKQTLSSLYLMTNRLLRATSLSTLIIFYQLWTMLPVLTSNRIWILRFPYFLSIASTCLPGYNAISVYVHRLYQNTPLLLKKGVCLCVCLSGYVFRHASMYGAETWHGGRGQAIEAQEHIFEVTPLKLKGHPEVKLLWKCPKVTKFGRKSSSNWSVMHCLGQR